MRAVVDAVRAGTPLDRIAILYAGPEPYARLAHEQLSAAGIALNGAAVDAPHRPGGGPDPARAPGLPTGGFRREDVFAWLAGAPLRHRGRPVPVRRWERLSREAGVVAGRGDWDRLLATFADDLRRRGRRAEADPDAAGLAGRAAARRDAARARELRDVRARA